MGTPTAVSRFFYRNILILLPEQAILDGRWQEDGQENQQAAYDSKSGEPLVQEQYSQNYRCNRVGGGVEAGSFRCGVLLPDGLDGESDGAAYQSQVQNRAPLRGTGWHGEALHEDGRNHAE